MTIDPGEYTFGAPSGRLLVRTGRAGLGAKVGHDLTIEATRWEGRARVDPTGLTSSEVTVTVEVESFAAREGTGGVKPLTDGDRAEIEDTLRKKILHPQRYPSITFRSTSVQGDPGALTVEGELTILGTTRPVAVRAEILGEGQVRGQATIRQSEFGIKPYSAFMGALKVKDEVVVEFQGSLAPAH